MNTLLNGSLCLTDIVEAAKRSHSAFSKSSKNGKIYFNITQWINEEPDKYNNNSSFQLNSTKEKREEEGKIYIGHAKYAPKPQIEAEDTADMNLEELPVNNSVPTDQGVTEPIDDLPF